MHSFLLPKYNEDQRSFDECRKYAAVHVVFFILAFFIQNFNNSTCKAKILGKISFWFSDSLLLARPNKLMSHFISVGVTKKGCFFQKLVLI